MRALSMTVLLLLAACGPRGRLNALDPLAVCADVDGEPCTCPAGFTLTEKGRCEAPASTSCSGGITGPGSRLTCALGSTTMDFQFIPAGMFRMGRSDDDTEAQADEVAHEVTITHPFFMARTEVTQAQYRLVMNANPSYFRGDERPVDQVTWQHAIAFCNQLSLLHGLAPAYVGTEVDPGATGYRLPTEAEWEYAARAGTTTVRYGDIDRIAWYGRSETTTVASLQPNGWGLYDMLGNVWEWTNDGYGPYAGGPETDPTGAVSATNRVIRGGGWNYQAGNIRVSNRNSEVPGSANHALGFRPVRVLR